MKVGSTKKMQDAISELRETYYEAVRTELRRSPGRPYRLIGQEVGVSEGLVYQIARMYGLARNSANDDAVLGEGAAPGGSDVHK
jgi:hypothetical protein